MFDRVWFVIASAVRLADWSELFCECHQPLGKTSFRLKRESMIDDGTKEKKGWELRGMLDGKKGSRYPLRREREGAKPKMEGAAPTRTALSNTLT